MLCHRTMRCKFSGERCKSVKEENEATEKEKEREREREPNSAATATRKMSKNKPRSPPLSDSH